MVENYTVHSHHLDHRQIGQNCVIAKNDVGGPVPSRFTKLLPSESHLYGKATVMDKENVGDVIWSWTEHKRSAARKGDPQFYERLNKDAMVRGSGGKSQESAAGEKERASPQSLHVPSPRPPSKPQPVRTQPVAGRKSRPHSPFTEVLANRPGQSVEAETAARYAEYAEQVAKRQQPLRCKSTRTARLRARERQAQASEHGQLWTMSKFKNVPSHFEQDRAALLGRAASAPDLSRAPPPPQPRAPVEPRTSSVSRGSTSRQARSTTQPSLNWPCKSAEAESAATSRLDVGTEVSSELASEVPSESPSQFRSRVSASFVSGTTMSGIERGSTLSGACPARSQSDKEGQQIGIIGQRMSQSSIAPSLPHTSKSSSSFVGHPSQHSSATAQKTRAASAPARRSEVPNSATASSVSCRSVTSVRKRPSTAHSGVKPANAPERKVGAGVHRPALSNPRCQLEVSAGVAVDAAPVIAASNSATKLDVSFVSDLWARHRPNMRGKDVVESLRRRPHSASA